MRVIPTQVTNTTSLPSQSSAGSPTRSSFERSLQHAIGTPPSEGQPAATKAAERNDTAKGSRGTLQQKASSGADARKTKAVEPQQERALSLQTTAATTAAWSVPVVGVSSQTGAQDTAQDPTQSPTGITGPEQQGVTSDASGASTSLLQNPHAPAGTALATADSLLRWPAMLEVAGEQAGPRAVAAETAADANSLEADTAAEPATDSVNEAASIAAPSPLLTAASTAVPIMAASPAASALAQLSNLATARSSGRQQPALNEKRTDATQPGTGRLRSARQTALEDSPDAAERAVLTASAAKDGRSTESGSSSLPAVETVSPAAVGSPLPGSQNAAFLGETTSASAATADAATISALLSAQAGGPAPAFLATAAGMGQNSLPEGKAKANAITTGTRGAESSPSASQVAADFLQGSGQVGPATGTASASLSAQPATASGLRDATAAGFGTAHESAPAAAAEGAGLSGASLLQSLRRSEMQVHVDGAEFGRVSVHATYGGNGIAAQIRLEATDLGSALGNALARHVPAMEQKLGGARASVSVNTGTDPGSGGAAGGHSGYPPPRRSTPLLHSPSTYFQSAPDISLAAPVLVGTGDGRRLDIRI